MFSYTPRVKGYSPGLPDLGASGRSASVYSGSIGSPESVVNFALRSRGRARVSSVAMRRV
jgi:hypothetical protein